MKNILLLAMCILGLVILVLGFGDMRIIAIGLALIILPFLYFFKTFFGKEEKIIDVVPEEKYESILSSKPRKFRKKIKITAIIVAAFSILFFVISFYLLDRYVFSKSYLALESAISYGCKELDPRTGCRNDPSKIIVPYDVDNDGIDGGVNDTFSKLLEKYDCTGDCIKRRCGCPI